MTISIKSAAIAAVLVAFVVIVGMWTQAGAGDALSPEKQEDEARPAEPTLTTARESMEAQSMTAASAGIKPIETIPSIAIPVAPSKGQPSEEADISKFFRQLSACSTCKSFDRTLMFGVASVSPPHADVLLLLKTTWDKACPDPINTAVLFETLTDLAKSPRMREGTEEAQAYLDTIASEAASTLSCDAPAEWIKGVAMNIHTVGAFEP